MSFKLLEKKEKFVEECVFRCSDWDSCFVEFTHACLHVVTLSSLRDENGHTHTWYREMLLLVVDVRRHSKPINV